MRKVSTGEPMSIPAATFNAFIDAAEDYQRRRQDQSRTAGRDSRHTGIVAVKNASGSAKDRFAVLGIDSPVFGPADNADEFKSRLALKGNSIFGEGVKEPPVIAARVSRPCVVLSVITAVRQKVCCRSGRSRLSRTD